MTTATEAGCPVVLSTTDGGRLEFRSAPGQSVLEAAAEAGATLPASCRQGTCGSCRGRPGFSPRTSPSGPVRATG